MSDSAKEVILGRIRQALADTTGQHEPAPASRAYRHADPRDQAALLDELAGHLEDYRAHVTRTTTADLPAAIAAACDAYGARRLVVSTDCPEDWLPAGHETLRDDPPLSHEQLDACDAVLTGCALAVAQTGTIALDGGAYQGRRALSLVPDLHLCVVRADQVVGIVPEGIARLAASATHPITFISGPSATSDIELSRVEGVHGPRTLQVFLVSD